MKKHVEDDHCQCCHCVCVCSVLSPCVFWWEMKEKVRYPARARTPGIYNTITEQECKRKEKREQLERPREMKMTKKSNKILFLSSAFCCLQIKRGDVSRDQFAFLDTPIPHLSPKRSIGH